MEHAGTRHRVCVTSAGEQILGGEIREVNSFHGQAVSRGALAAGLRELAHDGGRWVEALAHDHAPILGLMWHPEREPSPDPVDTEIIRHHFGYGENSK